MELFLISGSFALYYVYGTHTTLVILKSSVNLFYPAFWIVVPRGQGSFFIHPSHSFHNALHTGIECIFVDLNWN